VEQALSDRIDRAIADAMRARDQQTLAPLRMLKTALVHRRIEHGGTLTEDEAVRVVASLVKQRRESIEQFERAQRSELAAVEAREIGVLEAFLPPAMDQAEVVRIVEDAIAALGASTPKDMGAVMKCVMVALAGRHVDGKSVSTLVRSRLGG
jgi:hypothetical protein